MVANENVTEVQGEGRQIPILSAASGMLKIRPIFDQKYHPVLCECFVLLQISNHYLSIPSCSITKDYHHWLLSSQERFWNPKQKAGLRKPSWHPVYYELWLEVIHWEIGHWQVSTDPVELYAIGVWWLRYGQRAQRGVGLKKAFSSYTISQWLYPRCQYQGQWKP